LVTKPKKSRFNNANKDTLPTGFSAKDETKLYFFMGRPDKNTPYQYYKPKIIALFVTGPILTGNTDSGL
jgi:hypothetical protein